MPPSAVCDGTLLIFPEWPHHAPYACHVCRRTCDRVRGLMFCEQVLPHRCVLDFFICTDCSLRLTFDFEDAGMSIRAHWGDPDSVRS